MDINESLVLDIWELFGELVPYSKRNDFAVRYLKLFVDQDVELDEFDDIRDQDEHLDHALKVLENESEEDEDLEEDYEE